jgi:hypothetical protein
MNPKRENSGRTTKGSNPVVRPNLRMVRSVSWADIGDSTIADMVRLVTKYGAAIMFGVTSDQGAYSICVLDNDNKIKEYPHDGDAVEAVQRWLRDEYFGDGGKPSA